MSSNEASPSSPHAQEAPQLFVPGDLVDGRYEVVRWIAHGGMGLVYEVIDRDLGNSLALKAVKPHIARQAQTLDRFRREIKLSSRVTHPNVCRLYGAGLHREESGLEVHYLTMELLAGKTLSRRLREEGPFSPEEAGPILRQMAAGLAAAHEAGVVHRDFKCSNVMLVPQDDPETPWRVVLTDFGLARSLIHEEETSRLTATGQLMGTPAYFAPELLDGRQLTAASDVYGFGVVAYEMFSGELPFTGRSPFVVALRRLSEPPRPIRRLVPDLESRWVRLLERCLERRPEERPADGQALLTWIDRGADSSPDMGGQVPGRQALTDFDNRDEGWDLDAELAALTKVAEKPDPPADPSTDDPWASSSLPPGAGPGRSRSEGSRTARSPTRRGWGGWLMLVLGLVVLGLWWFQAGASRGSLRVAIPPPQLEGFAVLDASRLAPGSPSSDPALGLLVALRWGCANRRGLRVLEASTTAPLRGSPEHIAQASAAAEVLTSRITKVPGAWRLDLRRYSQGGTVETWARELTIPRGSPRLVAHAVTKALDEAFPDAPSQIAPWDVLVGDAGEVFDQLLIERQRLAAWREEGEAVDPPSEEVLAGLRHRGGAAVEPALFEVRALFSLAGELEDPRLASLAGDRFQEASAQSLADQRWLSSDLVLALATVDPVAAQRLVRRAREASPKDCEPLRLEGRLEQEAGDGVQALQRLQAAAARCPAWDLLAELSAAEARWGSEAAAREALDRALELAPEVEVLRAQRDALDNPTVAR